MVERYKTITEGIGKDKLERRVLKSPEELWNDATLSEKFHELFMGDGGGTHKESLDKMLEAIVDALDTPKPQAKENKKVDNNPTG